MEACIVQKPGDWNPILQSLPDAHVLQTWQWSQVKAPLGWKPLPVVWRGPDGQVTAAAMILQRSAGLPRLPGQLKLPRLNMLYVPRGPVLDWSDTRLVEKVLDDLQAYARQKKSIFLKIDPDVCVANGMPSDAESGATPGKNLIASLEKRGWIFSSDQIQFRNTVLIDLEPSEEAILARMRQKTRYNIHLAERKGVRIRSGTAGDLPMLYKMYAETSVRDGFVIRDQVYYTNVWQSFLQEGLAEILIADVDDTPIAGIILFYFGVKAWYLYGMSRNLHRDKMPNYLLQWEAMRRLKSRGIKVYDLWGAPDEFIETDSMWGVYKFKEGLGGTVLRTPGAWDYPSQPWLYRLYTQTLPHLLDLMRRRGQARAQREASL